MNYFLPGDTVICISKPAFISGLTTGKKYLVVESNSRETYIIDDGGSKRYWNTIRFKLLKYQPKNEIEILNAFQENFKEGI